MEQVVHVFLAAGEKSSDDGSILSLLLEADIIVQSVLLILVGMSIGCWVIIFNKVKVLQLVKQNTDEFLNYFWNAKKLDEVYKTSKKYKTAPICTVFRRGYVELEKLNRVSSSDSLLGGEANLERAMRRAAAEERTKLEHLVTFLATTGSTAPFIGLFGTVWGILRAFQKIGATGQATLQTVGPDIAHALIATAVGLAAAIPAVIAYNFINRKIRVQSQEMDNFISDFLNIIKRNYLAR